MSARTFMSAVSKVFASWQRWTFMSAVLLDNGGHLCPRFPRALFAVSAVIVFNRSVTKTLYIPELRELWEYLAVYCKLQLLINQVLPDVGKVEFWVFLRDEMKFAYSLQSTRRNFLPRAWEFFLCQKFAMRFPRANQDRGFNTEIGFFDADITGPAFQFEETLLPNSE